jgi:hypothetical protein
MLRFVTSIFTTLAVSTLFGLIFYENFVKVALIATIVQFVLFYALNKIYENYLTVKIEEVKNTQIKELNRNIATIECPCEDKNKQPVDIRFDRKISYTCSKCKKNINADPFVNTFLKTDPIYFDK